LEKIHFWTFVSNKKNCQQKWFWPKYSIFLIIK
jgi:hypothetical protein